ncbi:hypothetical protein BCR37DRAFT_381546 [Protomyces lactucae-debilis]|uniref:Secreted protein n=1 Tax=Protomyces lactucae-debilis TaxID=2754530 RepID=A0A1Y2F6X0_PROLT|nr:uncharacterized protein BCR37DRAFT_381546 [Protomyces lactucae-debilis]ORY79407.1 hypothetical protein BCR37DRAFT_381546 [Protomyces lactucae-debilis]
MPCCILVCSLLIVPRFKADRRGQSLTAAGWIFGQHCNDRRRHKVALLLSPPQLQGSSFALDSDSNRDRTVPHLFHTPDFDVVQSLSASPSQILGKKSKSLRKHHPSQGDFASLLLHTKAIDI